MLEPSGISHLIKETLAWDLPEAQLIGTFTQKRHWGPPCPLMLLWGNLSPLPPFLLPGPAPAHTGMVLWEPVTVMAMAYQPDAHIFILQSLQRRKSTWRVYV